MFGLFGPKRWDALPENLYRTIILRLGPDVETLEDLAERHGLFRQPFFRRAKREFRDTDFEIMSFAFLVGSMGNQLAQREKLVDAQKAFELSLKLHPEGNPIAVSLAELHAMQGDLDEALPPAQLALKSLWDDTEMRSSREGRQTHAMLASILSRLRLRDLLGEHHFQLCREALSIREGSASSQQLQRTALAALEFGGPNHESAVQEAIAATEDNWFDAAMELLQMQMNLATDTQASPLSQHAADMQFAMVNSRLLPLATACTILAPDHIDAWVLVAKLHDQDVQAGQGSAKQAFHFACQALRRIDRYLVDDSDSLWTKDQLLNDYTEDPEPRRRELIGVLQRTKHAATAEDLQLAAEYLG